MTTSTGRRSGRGGVSSSNITAEHDDTIPSSSSSYQHYENQQRYQQQQHPNYHHQHHPNSHRSPPIRYNANVNTTTHTNGNYNTTTRLTAVAAAAPPPPPRSRRCVRTWHDMTRTIWHYERIEQIGEGTYGQVYKARCKDTNTIVALKKIRVHHGAHWGMPPTVIREIKILKRLVHPNLVRMVEVVSSKGVEHLDVDDYHRGSDRSRSSSNKNNKRLSADGGGGGRTDKKDNDTNNAVVLSATAAADTTINTKKLSSSTTTICSSNASSSKNGDAIADARERYKGNLFLVLEYVPHDLTGLLDVAYKFNDLEIKCIFKQLLQALEYMHSEKYVHRDIKSSNILIDRNFRLKLADFGLARSIEPPLLDKLHEYVYITIISSKTFTHVAVLLLLLLLLLLQVLHIPVYVLVNKNTHTQNTTSTVCHLLLFNYHRSPVYQNRTNTLLTYNTVVALYCISFHGLTARNRKFPPLPFFVLPPFPFFTLNSVLFSPPSSFPFYLYFFQSSLTNATLPFFLLPLFFIFLFFYNSGDTTT